MTGMHRRILFHPAPDADWAKGLKPDVLGRSPAGTWLAVSDADALELLRRDRATLPLFATRQEFDEAMEGLDPAQAAEAVDKRLKVWSAGAASHVLPHLLAEEKRFLAALAKDSLEAPSSRGGARQFYLRQFGILDRLLIADRFRNWEPARLMETAFDELNELNRDVESLSARYGGLLPAPEPGLAEIRESLADALKQAMQRQGLRKGASPSGKVHANLKRGVYATPLDPVRVEGIREGHEPVQEWRNGYVTLWPDWDLGTLERGGGKADILYLDEAEFYRDHLLLTASQKAVAWGRRLKPVGSADLAAHLAERQLAVILIEMRAAPGFEAAEPVLAGEMRNHMKAETEALREGLALAAPSLKLPKGGLLETGERGVAEMSFWLSWAGASRWHDIQDDLEAAIGEKRAFLAALRAAQGP
jgi:hypothetical protein